MASQSDASTPASTGSVSFKAYLVQKGSDKPKEVRRFGMEQNEVTSFDLLKKKIRQVFPSLERSDFSINWKDFEGDDIIISSNDELLTALTETSDQVRRLYISVKAPIAVSFQPSFEWIKPIVVESKKTCSADNARDSDDSEDSADEAEEVLFNSPGCKRSWHSAARASSVKHHPHVYCDGCEKSISSHRYKCLECPDFDLCLDCESQLMHKEHIMVRIPLTMSHYTKLNNFSKSMRYMSEALHKIDSRLKKQERRRKVYEESRPCDDFTTILDGFLQTSKRRRREDKDKDSDKNRENRKAQREARRNAPGTSAHGCGDSQTTASAPNPDESTPMSSKTSTSKTQNSGRNASAGCPFSSSLLGSFLNPETIGNLLNHQNLQNLQQLFEHMSPVPEQLLKEVSQNLAKVNLNDKEPSATSAATAPTNPFSVNKKSASATEPDGAVPSSSTAPQETEKQIKPKASAQETAKQPEESVTVVENSQSVSGRSSRSSSEDVEEWTVVDALKEGSANQASIASMYPKLPEVEPTSVPSLTDETVQAPFHNDPNVNNCLQALTEMGYDASQQMIIDLSVSYKGNVNRVLNALLS